MGGERRGCDVVMRVKRLSKERFSEKRMKDAGERKKGRKAE